MSTLSANTNNLNLTGSSTPSTIKPIPASNLQDRFKSAFGDSSFEPKSAPTIEKLPTPGPRKIGSKSFTNTPKKNNFLNWNGWGTVGLVADSVSSLFAGLKANDSTATKTIDGAYDTAANVVSLINPAAGALMKAGSAVAGFTRSLGGSTDQMTGADKWFDSVPGQLLGGFVNGMFGSNTRDFAINQLMAQEIGGSYGGSMADLNDATKKAGKKYGLFSQGAKKDANAYIDLMERTQNRMVDIANEAADDRLLAALTLQNMINYQNLINGGTGVIRAAKLGEKLSRVKHIDFSKKKFNPIEEFKEGGELNWKPIIDWTPILESTIEEFKEGGTIEWIPTLLDSFKEGGKTKESEEKPLTNLKNIIPEGALHAHKHHMENDKNITKKGIPVIDLENDSQLAEIERDEIIFTLEVTLLLEDYYKIYYDSESSLKDKDEAAINAGKLLVQEILFNTDDRTSLINSLKQGGKL